MNVLLNDGTIAKKVKVVSGNKNWYGIGKTVIKNGEILSNFTFDQMVISEPKNMGEALISFTVDGEIIIQCLYRPSERKTPLIVDSSHFPTFISGSKVKVKISSDIPKQAIKLLLRPLIYVDGGHCYIEKELRT